MAYKVDLACAGCGTPRVSAEVRDQWNGLRGLFCRRCAAKALAAQREREDAARARQGRGAR